MRRDNTGRWIGRLVALGVLAAAVFGAVLASTGGHTWLADFDWTQSIRP